MKNFLKDLGKNLDKVGREFKELERLFSDDSEARAVRRLVFYAESSIYYRYYEDYIDYILNNSDLAICYITSDAEDQIFDVAKAQPRIKPFYLKNMLAGAFARLDGKVLVLTAPDLNSGAIKRAPHPVHHVYTFHGLSSAHHYFRPGAFDHYDAMLCLGQYQVAEVRKTEEIYSLKNKELVVAGYPRIEHIWREHQEYRRLGNQANQRRVCLIAPSWWWDARESNLLEGPIEDLFEEFGKTDFEVWLRPHPEYIKRYGKRVDEIAKIIDRYPNISLKTDLPSMQVLHEADVLITEHSSICFDFALGTERPVVFVDTPAHTGNPEYQKVGIEPVENAYRSRLGVRIKPEEIRSMPKIIEDLLANQDDFRAKLPLIRDELLANWQHAAEVGGRYLIDKAKN